MKYRMLSLVRLLLCALFLPLFSACEWLEKIGTRTPTPEAAGPVAGPVKGPHGGRWLADGEFALEVTIFERGVPPEFRVYAYEARKPLDPAGLKLTIEVRRLAGRVDTIRFTPVNDYLLGDQEIYEPHSFAVQATAERQGRKHLLEYSQYEARVEVDPEARKVAGVEIAEAGPAQIRRILELPGEIALNPDRVAHIVPRFDGVVTEIRKNLGDKVAKGETLAVLESRELASSNLEFVQAVQKLEFSSAAFEREEALWKKKVSPEEDYLARRQALEEARLAARGAEQWLKALGVTDAELKGLLANSEQNLARHEIRAPQDGVVIEKRVAVGAAVKDDADLFTIADLGTVLAKVTIYDNDLRSVRTGQEVTVKSEALGAEARGKLEYLGPMIGKETRAAVAHVLMPNPNQLWRPGLFVTVFVVQEEFTVPVAVAAEAVQQLRDWEVVFLQEGNLFEACPLELGRRDEQWVEVLGGLPAGMKYVAKNSFLIKADILKSGATHDH